MSRTTEPGRTLLDRGDERLKDQSGLLGSVKAFADRVRAGDLGSLPVVVGLVVIWTIFETLNPIFLSPNNLVNMLFDCSTVGVISLGIVCVLLVGEIDLSVGSVSGLSSAILGVLWVQLGLAGRRRDPRRARGRIPDRLRLCASLQPPRHAKLRLDSVGSARVPGPAALHPRADRIDQPALWLALGEFRPDAGDAALGLACARRLAGPADFAFWLSRRAATPSRGSFVPLAQRARGPGRRDDRAASRR